MPEYPWLRHLSPTSMATSPPLPSPPRRILVGASDAAAVAARIAAVRPDLELRAIPHTQVTDADLSWAECYVGFRRPSVTTMGSVRWVHSTGAGVDPWLAPDALAPATLLTRSPERFGPAIAEWAVARILAESQQLGALAAAQRERQWASLTPSRIAGRTALILGTGEIGSAIARALTALGVRVIGVSRTGNVSGAMTGGRERVQVTSDPECFHAVHTPPQLLSLVGDVDWIIAVLPDTPATRGLLSRDVLSRCQGAMLLNAGRGAVVEESAIPEALDRGWLRAAALDVFQTEPLPSDSPLWTHPRVTISPHCSGPTTIAGAADGFLECLTTIERGERPRWAIDLVRGY